MAVLGLDTSNYTTSVAVFDGSNGWNEGRLLDVRPGELGLRQSDALFQHVKRLPSLFEKLKEQGLLSDIRAVGASTRPRAVEGSYMPCFLAGTSQGQCLADTLGVPFFAHSHQQGHLAAAAWSAGHMELLDRPFLAWHLSGGTTELLKVEPDGYTVQAEIVGGTQDISAGQLIDRTGVLLGLQFPAGKALDALRWVRRGLRYFYRGCRAVVRMLPVIWQWILTAFLMVVTPVFFFLLTITCHGAIELFWGMLWLLSILADVAIVCYGGWCFGLLLKGAKRMAKGELNHQIPTKYLFGTFKDFAEQLNSVAGAARIAAERQMKSERMKTELITNVSHDIKTPLTSIINYVDLMKKPHSEGEQAQYLEVLDRQSQRLKKLIDDLMEMSKASTGNLTVELQQLDAAETINQALGEFADKLDRAHLTPVFRHPDFPVTMIADGKLVWRVLSNVLSNAVKYAMPDTRLYVDLMVLQGNAVIAVKNISREQLNVGAEELMERFVRGDASRNTEGSGLGLNIAKSLVELQSGQMHLMVDGDLFKVTLIFPCG